MRARFTDSTKVAHFLDRLIFCMFAEDVGLLPNKVFSQFLKKYRIVTPGSSTGTSANSSRRWPREGTSTARRIPHFNGNLFDDTPPLDLIGDGVRRILIEAGALDWSEMDPSIFGTLFERVMDPPSARSSGPTTPATGHRDAG